MKKIKSINFKLFIRLKLNAFFIPNLKILFTKNRMVLLLYFFKINSCSVLESLLSLIFCDNIVKLCFRYSSWPIWISWPSCCRQYINPLSNSNIGYFNANRNQNSKSLTHLVSQNPFSILKIWIKHDVYLIEIQCFILLIAKKWWKPCFLAIRRLINWKTNVWNSRSELSQGGCSTSWIHPQSGYIPTGLVHYVDWSAKRICPSGIRPLVDVWRA